MTRDLSRLLRPKSIAVIGGGTWCGHVVANCRKLGFGGPVWPVHPEKLEIAGTPAFRSIADLPAAPDAAFVGVNRKAAIAVMDTLARRGAGGAVVYASGFREAQAETAEGSDLQEALLQAAGETVMIGPNCYGFLNYLDGAGLWPDQQGGTREERGVAIITQSSNIAINLTMQRRGLPLAYMVTVGNQAQTGFAEIGSALLADERVTALGLHIEGIGDLRAFEALAARARESGKPMVALKAGRSPQARSAAVSHTASLAGSDAGGRALLARLGIAQVDSLGALLETLKLCHVTGALTSRRVVSMSCSGGEASLVADSAAARGIDFPPLDPDQVRGLRTALGPRVALANPLDYHTYIWNDAAAMTATFGAMLKPGLGLGLVVLDFPRTDRCDDSDWDTVVAALAAAHRDRGVSVAIVASLPETMPENKARRLIAMGIAPLAGMEDALDAIAAAAWLGETRRDPAPVLLPAAPAACTLLSEAEGKAALAAYGVEVPRSRRCTDAAALRRAGRALSLPLALKGEGVAHKTEAGAVALNLGSAAELAAAAQRMPGHGWLVEEMVTGGVAEMLVGVVIDAAHGYVLTLGAGGTLTEILADAVSLLVPAGDDDIRAALAGLRISALLRGCRGAPPADIGAIVDTVRAVQAYVTEHRGRVEEVEINPLICTPTGAVAADVLIRIGEKDA